MKKNTKGFTLIELLAVIIILAIIALIAVPVIVNIITKARQSAAEDSTYGVLKAAQNYQLTYLMENPNEAFPGTEFTFNGSTKPAGLDFDGTIPTAGTIKVDGNGLATIDGELTVNGLKCTQANGVVDCK